VLYPLQAFWQVGGKSNSQEKTEKFASTMKLLSYKFFYVYLNFQTFFSFGVEILRP